MSSVRGRLLIGGMTLKHLHGDLVHVAGEPDDWRGHLLVEPRYRELLETERPYRLELDDGRSGQVILSRLELAADWRYYRVTFEGISVLEETLAEPAANKS